MTERQAWLFLAKAWDSPDLDFDSDCIVIVGGAECYGLCPCLDYVGVSEEIYWRMKAKIARLKNRFAAYKWPHDKAGAKARAAFCRLQAKKLTRPSPKKANRSKRK